MKGDFLGRDRTFMKSTWKGDGGGLEIYHDFADSIVFKQ